MYQIKSDIIETNMIEKTFFDEMCQQAQIFCKPSSAPMPAEEFSLCSSYLKKFEDYIIGTNDKSIIASSTSNSICGKIFKTREPVYVCRDCSTDDTCVFCRLCFVKSEHTKHNYEMHLSGGGGYCDCGDEEAWKTFPRCNLHGGSNELSSNISIDNFDSLDDMNVYLENVSDDVKMRFLQISSFIFKNFKRFVMRPLCKANHEQRLEELKNEMDFVRQQIGETKTNEFTLVLYNNEFHNFDQVISLFKRCLQCTTEQAMAFANIVDRDGRCMALRTNDRDDVDTKQSDILTRSKTQTSMELLCRIHHPLIYSIQTLLNHLLRWLYEFCDQYSKLRILLCQYLFSDEDKPIVIAGKVIPKCSFIQDIFDNHMELWKSARSACINFLMTSVFKEVYFKKLFAVQMTKNYTMVIDHYARDDHNAEDSMISLNCQIFTIISFAKYLLESHNILDKIMKIVYDTLMNYSKPLRHPKIENKIIYHFEKAEFETQKKFDPFERRMRALNDIKFLLTSLLTAFVGYKESNNSQLWTENAISNFMNYFRTFADFLCLIQDTDKIERITEHHVEHDPNWKTGIVMMYDSIHCITLSAQLLTSNRLCWDQAFMIFRQIIKTRIVDLEHSYGKSFRLFSYSTLVIDNDWPSKCMSAIKPLHRFMAALLTEKKYRDLLKSMEKDCLLDQALQMVVFASQQAGNMWIRNGSVPYILTQQIKCLTLSSEMFDRDLQLIQQMAICISPDKFILKCIHKFDLKNYFEGDPCKQSDKKALLQRIEDFLHTLIMTIFFRHRIGVGKNITKEDIYAHTIFHILCVKSMSHSKLMKKLNPTLLKYSKGSLMEIVDKVADQRLLSQIVIFSAKTSLLVTHFDRYSPYYSIQDRNEAELSVQNSLKKEELSTAMNPPIPIDLTEDCQELLNYISNQCFVEILNKFLYFCITKRNGEFWTDTILDMVLYLIGASLLEDVKSLEIPPEHRKSLFIDTATNGSYNIDIICNLELLCDKINCDQQLELIKWTIRKWNEVLRMKDPGLSGGNDSVNMDVDLIDNANLTDNVQTINQNKVVKADAAKKRREQLMSKMWNMQKKFINENSELLTENVDNTNMARSSKDNTIHTIVKQPKKERDLTCILCQERNLEDSKDRPIVLIAGAWRSAVLAKIALGNQFPEQFADSEYIITDNSDIEFDIDAIDESALPIWSYLVEEDDGTIERVAMRSIISMLDHAEETFISTCGHVMHYDCKTNYMKNMVKQRQSIARTKGVLYPRIYNRCPLCKCVCNIDIPIIKSDLDKDNISRNSNLRPDMTFDEWIGIFNQWIPTVSNTAEVKKVDGSIHWWNKLGTHLSNIMKLNTTLKGNDSLATDEDLISCLAYRTSLAIKLQPAKLTKDTYKSFETVRSSISDSSSQELIELDYAVIYTISVWEKIMTKQNSSLLNDIPERHAYGLTCLIKSVCKSHQYSANNETVSRECRSFFMFIHQMLFDCNTNSFHKAWKELNKFQIPMFILEVDFTYVLGSLLFIRYSLETLSNDNKNDKHCLDKHNYNLHIVRLIYQFASVQALLSLQITNVDNVEVSLNQLMTHSPVIWNDDNIRDLHLLRQKLGKRFGSTKWSDLNANEVAVCFFRSLLPFLRCAAFLLLELDSLHLPSRDFIDCHAEFNDLITALNIDVMPFPTDQLPTYIENHLKLVNTMQVDDPKKHCNYSQLPHDMPEMLPKLIDLPREFTDVITIGLDQGCSLSHQAPGTVSEISICLICGVTVCLSGYCCRRIEESSGTVISGAQIHARQCHEGYSLFLNTRNSKVVVFFYQARWQINLDPVYVDKFGESDIDLKRGNPLFLNTEAYAKLERSWLDHSVGCTVNDGFFSNDFFV